MEELTDLQVREDRRPLYLIVRDKLWEQVDEGVFRPGRKLPRETELARLMNVSRSTLREALRIAREEGWIVQKQGLGTFVSNSAVIEKGLEVLESIDSMAERHGWTCETEELVIEECPAPARMVEALGLEEQAPVVRVARVKTVNGSRAAYIEDFVPSDIMPLEEIKTWFKGSVLDLLLERSTLLIDYAWANIFAQPADERMAEVLQLPVGTGVLLAEEILYSTDSQPFEYSLNYMVSKYFNFHIIRTVSST